jgi:hypothetical protein
LPASHKTSLHVERIESRPLQGGSLFAAMPVAPAVPEVNADSKFGNQI